jgi:nicotinamide riboside kinase
MSWEIGEEFMNHEMPDDYSELLDEYDFSKAVRGKYHEKYRSYQGKIPVNITFNDGDRYVTLRTVKVKAIVTPDGKLTVQLDGDITPGEYRVTLIIEEPATQNAEPTSLENER